MADQKISELTNVLGSAIEDGDEFVVVDSSANQTKAITASELRTAVTNSDLTVTGDFTVAGDLTVQGTTITVDSATAQNIVLGDNDKMTFGAGSDLQIYHASSTNNSVIQETGSGNLLIYASNISMADAGGNEFILMTDTGTGGTVELKHNTSTKLATTSTGISVTGNATFADNGKAIFGAGSDLQIYHSGAASFISDQGTGRLKVLATDLSLNNAGDTANYIVCTDGGDVQLYHNGSSKLATTSTGIDVTGTVTADGLTVDGDANLSGAAINFDLDETDTTDLNTRFRQSSGQLFVQTLNDAKSLGYNRLNINHTTGDISFYEDTGTTPKFFWDASAESLGIGTSSPSRVAELYNTSNPALRINNGTDIADIGLASSAGALATGSTSGALVIARGGANDINLATNGTNRVTIDSSGNVGIGTSSPDNNSGYTALTMSNTSGSGGGQVYVKASSAVGVFGADNASSGTNAKVILQTNTSHPLSFGTSGTERMRIDSSGNVGIGDSSPYTWSSVQPSLNLRGTSASFPNRSGALIFKSQSGTHMTVMDFETGNDLRWYQSSNSGSSWDERMRIDSSGNLLVGKSATNYQTVGVEAKGNGSLWATADGNGPLVVTRKTSDGTLADFYKDTTKVGSIGVLGSRLNIGTGDVALRFDSTNNALIPWNVTTNSSNANSISFGDGTDRFKDLYLSGTIEIENGTGNVGVGKQALNSNTGSNNTAVGYQAGYATTTGLYNTYLGYKAGISNSTSNSNTFVGVFAGEFGTGNSNTYIGESSGYAVTTGSKNTILGRYNGNQGGLDIRTSSNNIVLSDGDGNPRISVNSSGVVRMSNASANPSTAYGARFYPETSSRDTLYLGNSATGARPMVYFYNANGFVGRIETSGSATSYVTSSDHRLKENVVELTGATDRLKQLEPKRFNFLADADTTVDGFLAHEVQSIVPEAISGTKDAVDDDGNPVYQGIDQSKLVPLLVATIKELEARITALENA